MGSSGVELFARYAYPPNALGYCGPEDASVLLRRGAGAAIDIAAHARRFEGAWVYLELIAAAAGIADPLDPAVVEAYWLGNELLERLDRDSVPELLRERLAGQPVTTWLPGNAHHGYHVFVVYPWVRLLGREQGSRQALHVLEQCRIRWGEVLSVTGAVAQVCGEHLRYVEGRLSLGPPTAEVVSHVRTVPIDTAVDPASGGAADPERAIRPGDRVAMHWNWICDVLDEHQTAALQSYTLDQLARTNDALAAAR